MALTTSSMLSRSRSWDVGARLLLDHGGGGGGRQQSAMQTSVLGHAVEDARLRILD